MTPATWLLLALGMLSYTAGEVFAKHWSLNPSLVGMCGAAICYGLGGLLFLPALRLHGGLAVLSTVWSCMAMVVSVLLGTWWFAEDVALRQWCGVLLALAAIWLLH